MIKWIVIAVAAYILYRLFANDILKKRKKNEKQDEKDIAKKVASGEMIVVDKIAAAEFKTKAMAQMLSDIGAGKKSLVVLPEKDEKVVKSLANIPGVKTAATGVNTYDVVNADKLILSVDAAKKLEEVYA